MASLEAAIQQQQQFSNEQVKANINVMYTANWLHNRISAVLKPHGITHEQFNVLRILRGSNPKSMCQKEILQRMIAPSSNLTLIVKKLVAKKLIVVLQSDKDKREYVINISKQGLELLKVVDSNLDKHKDAFNPLTDAEAKKLNTLLDKLRG